MVDKGGGLGQMDGCVVWSDRVPTENTVDKVKLPLDTISDISFESKSLYKYQYSRDNTLLFGIFFIGNSYYLRFCYITSQKYAVTIRERLRSQLVKIASLRKTSIITF